MGDLEFKSQDFNLSVDFLSPNHPFGGLINVGVGMVFRHRVCQLAFCCCIKKTDKLNF
jgi:hypothetical protein